MKKGFTLIELLAVIVILAIIAVIAVPIVLNIIDETKESATLRSAEFYLDAVEYAISDAYLNHGGLQDGEYPITQEGNLCKTALPCSDENTLKVQVNGKVPESGTITITNGNITEIELKYEEKTIVKNSDGDLVYQEGTLQVYKPQYYMNIYGYAQIGENLLDEDWKEKISEIDTLGYSIYSGIDIDSNNKVANLYVCFTRNKTEYCLKGHPEATEINISILEEAFKDVEDACYINEQSYVYGDMYTCTADNMMIMVCLDELYVYAQETGVYTLQEGVYGSNHIDSESLYGGEGV